MQSSMRKKIRTFITVLIALIGIVYLILLFPERDPALSVSDLSSAKKQPFAWNQDAYWTALEEKYRELRDSGCESMEHEIEPRIARAQERLRQIALRGRDPDDPAFEGIERSLFEIGPLVGGCRTGLAEYISFATDVRRTIKRQSERWDMNSEPARVTLYRLLYGSRGAVEEIMMQVPAAAVPALINETDEPSATPSAVIRGVRIHSGDILVSRGGAPTSALIARGNDYPGNFSHIAFVYIDPRSGYARIVESHIEVGVVVSTVEQYLGDKKLRVMVLRPRADLPEILRDPMAPHKAAEYAYTRATRSHIPYDFEMNYKDPSKLFCSEVASEAYSRYGIRLWAGVSHISSPGLRRWLSGFGVRYFETQEPSDLEYDPQLRVVAEWRDPGTLRKDRLDNAVTEVMLEGAERGEELSYQWFLLPLSRIAKAYSVILNRFGKAGPVPEGMSAATALRAMRYESVHRSITERLAAKAERFRNERGYEPPYWELVRLAREAKREI